ncbi:MAG TPA: hypothetical protein VFJ45_10825 [bacterium]|nr:hypothetical protein [bacterium]
MSLALRRALALSALLTLLAAGCGTKASTRVMVVLFDLSASTGADAIRQQYLSDFSKVLDGVTAGGRVAADIIDENPLAHSTFPINVSFDRYDPLKENKLSYDRRIREQREAVTRAAQAVVRVRPSRRTGTNVMDALQLAERVFSAFEGTQRVLVIFSDMIEQSRRYDFSRENLTSARITQIVEGERSAGRLPSLENVNVCVVGAGAAKSGGISSERFLAIREFWLQYFKAAGAQLPKDRYGSALLKCP